MMVINKNKGFSLIELMIVVAIIGMLAAFAVPSYQSYMQQGRASTAQGDLLNLAANVEIYKQGNLSYNGVTAAGVYSAQSPTDATTPHFDLSVEILNAGRAYRLRASANQSSAEAKGDGTYWFNPKGRNCYFTTAGAPYSPTCNGGTEW